MGRRISRSEPLSEQDNEKYREVRRQVAEELPDIRRRARAARPRILLKQVLQSLKAERERQGVSLTDLSERSGIDRGSLSKIENDQDPIVTMNTLLRYADTIGKTLIVQIEDGSAASG